MIFLIFGTLLIVAYTLPPFVDQTSLFDKKDGVITLHEGNIKEFLDHSPLPVMVMFYASWCGHCIAFSNTYKKLQKEVENWDIYVAAINCANYQNNKICDNYFSISSYPTIYIFECLQSVEDKKRVDYKTLSSSMNLHSMRKATAGYLAKQDKCRPIIHNSKEFTLQFWEKFKEGLTTFDRLVIIIDDKLDSDFIDSVFAQPNLDKHGPQNLQQNLDNVSRPQTIGTHLSIWHIRVKGDPLR
ncbi:Sulfhydryl oxidase 1 [Thelohanellus kitauei]|uniref:Sulfhydryl oxidase 1 n=1 Tax=Thelohanellus kitauei TaxID=669202 RepID=A0A0C2N5B2_THEKT|nr:Sulfhydryl oxidase 1 [Thelohanellus kitauei]